MIHIFISNIHSIMVVMKKKPMTKIIILIFFSILSHQSNSLGDKATTNIVLTKPSGMYKTSNQNIRSRYYVDILNPISSDTNPGTDSLPWKYCPGMSGWTGFASLTAGDTVYFKNNGEWAGNDSDHVLITTGGVLYDGSSWGPGTRAKLRSNRRLIQEKGIIRIDTDHPTIETVIRGFEISGKEGNCTGIRFQGNNYFQQRMTGAVKRIENCIINDAGVDTANWSYGIEVTSISSGQTKAPGLLKNVEIINCRIHRPHRSGIVIYPNGANDSNKVVNVLVRGCEVDSAGQSPTSIGAGIVCKNWVDSIILEFNYLHHNRGTMAGAGVGIELAHSNSTSPLGVYNCTIRYNLIKNNRYCGVFIYASGGKDVCIYGNIFEGNGNQSIMINCVAHTRNKMKIYNNTFFKNFKVPIGWAGGDIEFSPGSKSTYDTLEIVNNIFI